MRPLRRRMLSALLSLVVGGTCLQLGNCTPGGLKNFITSLNPCGTILLCDPAEYRLIMENVTEPGVDPSFDPFCVWPPFCSPDVDPLYGGVGLLP
jgi:hypothetical protein